MCSWLPATKVNFSRWKSSSLNHKDSINDWSKLSSSNYDRPKYTCFRINFAKIAPTHPKIPYVKLHGLFKRKLKMHTNMYNDPILKWNLYSQKSGRFIFIGLDIILEKLVKLGTSLWYLADLFDDHLHVRNSGFNAEKIVVFLTIWADCEFYLFHLMVNYHFQVIKGPLIGKAFHLNHWIGNTELKSLQKSLHCNLHWKTVIVIGENGA